MFFEDSIGSWQSLYNEVLNQPRSTCLPTYNIFKIKDSENKVTYTYGYLPLHFQFLTVFLNTVAMTPRAETLLWNFYFHLGKQLENSTRIQR